MPRISLSKRLRMEVFKRDSFTCQYCGRKAPDIILHVDHIEPVSAGGTNDIINLITSCQECNLGKSNIPLSDNSALEKQRKQLEELNERREQIEMLFEWKKSLDNLDGYALQLLVDYVEKIISPYTLNESGKAKLLGLSKKYETSEVFAAIDISKNTYLKYGKNDKLKHESVENFINKIPGIIINNRRTPVESKLHYIKATCRNRFSYWDNQKGMTILKKYANSLRDYGWSEEQILADLEGEVYELATSSNNWSEWRNQMEGWIKSIQSWEKQEEKPANKEMSLEELNCRCENCLSEIQQFIEVMIYLQRPIMNRDDSVVAVEITNIIKGYISDQVEAIQLKDGSIEKLKPNFSISNKYGLAFIVAEEDSSLHFGIENLCDLYYTPHWLQNVYLPDHKIHTPKDAVLFKNVLFGLLEQYPYVKKESYYNPRL